MESDLDPNAFLQSVRELKEKRQKEDNERYEQLEAQILQDRELRQARKLERERSLSPEKTTPQSSRHPTPTPRSPSTQPTQPTASRDTTMAPPEARESPASMEHQTIPPKPSTSGSGLTRTNTLSWSQRRPNSISVRSRPLSTVATENSAARSPQKVPARSPEPEPASASASAPATEEDKDEQASKEQIAQALGAKDPTWFRQTADRGRNSPAYRSNRDDVSQDAVIPRRQLPGMARDAPSIGAASADPPPEPVRSNSSSRPGSARGNSAFNARPISMASISEKRTSDTKSPLPALESQRFAAPGRERSSTADGKPPVLGRTMSNAQTQLTEDRPVSPTKGMGGFVQSAFMKRTDSVNKRWSATPGTSLSRQESTASVPSRFGSIRDNSNMAGSRSMPKLEQSSTTGESESRPSSSHSTISNLNLGPELDAKDRFTKPATTSHPHSRSKSVASLANMPDDLTSPPLSPSKRWSRSPAKASWLESALTRPESPRPTLQSQPSWMADLTKAKQQRSSGEPHGATEGAIAPPESPKPSFQSQPSWMAEIAKAKQQRNSGEPTLSQDTLDAAKAQTKPKTTVLQDSELVGPTVLKRSSIRESGTPSSRNVTPPTKAKPAALAGRPTSLELKSDIADPPKDVEKIEPAIEQDATLQRTEPDEETKTSAPPRPSALSSPFMSPHMDGPQSYSATSSKHSSFTSLNPKPETPETQPQSSTSFKPLSFPSPKPKPDTPPNKDFRAGLKSRSDLGKGSSKEEPEFKAMFGKLKKAQAEKFVAPDELKNNIVRGKAGLAASAGPQKSERKDEFRKSLVQKKDEIKTKAAESDLPTHKVSPAPPAALPEALTIKKQLGRSNSTLNVPRPEKQRRDVTPEALSLHRTLRGKQRAPSPEKADKTTDVKPLTFKPLALKPAEIKPADNKPAETRPTDIKAAETKPLETKPAKESPAEVKVVETKPTELKRSDFKPAEVKPLDTKPIRRAEIKPAEIKPVEVKPTEVKPAEVKPAEVKPTEVKPTEVKPTEVKPAEVKPTEVKPTEVKPTEIKPTEFKPLVIKPLRRAETKPLDVKPLDVKPLDIKPARTWPAEKETPSPEKKDESKPAPASNKFANRFNPALAGMLARGPPSQPTTSRSASPLTHSGTKNTAEEAGAGGQLTHMTKNRAKGPKRRKPNAKSATSEPEPISAKRVPSVQSVKQTEVTSKSSAVITPLQPAPKSAAVRAASLRLSSGQFSGVSEMIDQAVGGQSQTSPKVTEKTPASIGRPTPQTPSKAVASLSSAPRKASSSILQQPITPMKPSGSRSLSINNKGSPTVLLTQTSDSTDADKENNGGSVKNAAAMWGASQRGSSQKRSSPIQLPTKKDEEAAMKSAGLLATSPLRYKVTSPPPQGLGITESPVSPRSPLSGPSTPTATGVPSRPTKSSRVVSASLSSKDLPSLPDPRSTKAGQHLFDYFGEVPCSAHKLCLDTQSILSERPGESGKIKTLRKSIHEITGDGKSVALPPQEEHILYENSMYICTHVFGSANGSKVTEAYLWAGMGVSEAAIQDAQIFAKRIAKEAGAGQRSTQLLVVDQGREPPAFFEALGGIVIVRRGSRAESSTKPYMLCGRPHMGHVAFDEVDLSKASLCSDFPYLIARPVTLQETKMYLWRGSTCDPDAVDAALAEAMNLNPSTMPISVDEGREPQDLLLLMSDLRSTVCESPKVWSRTRHLWDHSSARLFRIQAASPKAAAGGYFSSFLASRRPSSVSSLAQEVEFNAKEISPFTQTDLEPEGCFVLDCGSSVLVLPGPLLQKQQHFHHTFVQALLFADDYAMSSVSAEDRQAIPTATVILDGMPRDAQLRFRKWDKTRGVWGTGGMMAGRRMDGFEEKSETLSVGEALEVCYR